MTYSLLTHFKNVENHRLLIEKVVAAWEQCVGIPLLFYSNKGEGQAVDSAFFDTRSQFGRLDDAIGIRLKSSRKRDAFKLELYFTNPSRNWYGDLNYICAEFPDTWIEGSTNHGSWDSILNLCGDFIELTQARSLRVEHEDISLSSPGFEVLGLVGAAIGCKLGHICYLGSEALMRSNGKGGLMRAGWKIHQNWDHGCLAFIPFDRSIPKTEEAWKLFDALERSEFLVRDDEAGLSLIKTDQVTCENVGAFLSSYERNIGRVFGYNYSDGYRPIDPSQN